MKLYVQAAALALAAILLPANAAKAEWTFDEKIVTDADVLGISNGRIHTADKYYEGAEMSSFYRNHRYWDFDGNELDYKSELDTSLHFEKDKTKNDTPAGYVDKRPVEAVRYPDGIVMLANQWGYSDFSDVWLVDGNGDKVLPDNKWYYSIERIDNDQFVVLSDSVVSILTAKGIIGEALNTDIMLSINGAIMPCRNVNDYVVIQAEKLSGYGFDVWYDDDKRMLYINRNPDNSVITAADEGSYGEESGSHFADIYGTDINVEFNGRRIYSYSIDGEMLIKPEDLAGDGITLEYNDDDRMLYMTVDGLESR